MAEDAVGPRLEVGPSPVATAPATSLGPPAVAAGVAAFTVVLLVLAALGAALLRDGDTSWHLATGALILSDGLPTVDPFSFTAAGEQWIAKEWLAQLVLLAADRAAGWSGLVLVTATAVATAFGLVAGELRRHVRTAGVVVALGLAFVLAAPHLHARPHALALPVVVGWTVAACRALERGPTPAPPWWSLGLVALWANLHGSVLLAPVLAVAVAVDAVAGAPAERRGAVARAWAAFVGLTVVAACVTPYGAGSLLAAVEVLRLGPALDLIGEWAPADLASPGAYEWALLVVLVATVVGPRLPWPRSLLLVGLLVLAATAVRNGALLGLLGPLVVAAPLAAARPGLAPVAGPRPRSAFPGASAAVVAATAVAVAGGVVAVTGPQPPASLSPTAATAAVRDAGGDRLLHEYAWGGHLIATGVRTYVDGRTELFGGAFVAEHAAALAAADVDLLDRVLRQHRIDATMLRPATPAVDLLDLAPGWRRVHTDELAVVHARAPGADPGLGLAARPDA